LLGDENETCGVEDHGLTSSVTFSRMDSPRQSWDLYDHVIVSHIADVAICIET
jgi:hypothetical protein